MIRCDGCKHTDICVCAPRGCEYFELDLEEHDKQIRVDAIREYKNKLSTDVCARAQHCYKDTFDEREQEIFNFATKTFLDALDYFAEELKEEKND